MTGADATEHGGSASDAFDVVIPSLPGYGFSGKPAATGWDPDRIARAWAVLMQRLGYTRYVAQGGDWGTAIVRQRRRSCVVVAALLATSTASPGLRVRRKRVMSRNGKRVTVISDTTLQGGGNEHNRGRHQRREWDGGTAVSRTLGQ